MPARRAVAGRRLLLIAALVLTSAAACSGSSESAPTLHDIAALLARQGKAVLDHDRSAFVAALDPARTAAAFRSAQEGAYANLIKLPLTTWSYRIDSRTDDGGNESTASTKYGAPAVIVHLELRYALRGVDPIPTSHDLWWTFVRQDGRVVAAGDDDLTDGGGVSWRGPWDFGPLEVLRGAHSLVLGHPDNVAGMRAVESTVESAVPAVSAVWGTGWTRDVAAILPSSPDELAAQVGASSDVSTQVAAVAVSDGQDPTSGAVFGQRLIVNPAALRRLSPIGRQITIRHETTHIADARATSDATPRWLAEGFADYVGNLGSGQSPTTVAAELRNDVLHGRVPKALPGEADFDTGTQAAQAYEGGWLACRLIAQRAGQAQLVRFYRLIGVSPADSDVAVAAALRTVLDESTAQFTAAWRGYLKSTLG